MRTPSRRSFVRNALGASALSAVARIAGARPPRLEEGVFDCHLHCPSDEAHQIEQWYPVMQSFKDFAQYLDRAGVQRGVIANGRNLTANSPAEFIAGNREVARYVEKYDGRFIGSAVVNPVFLDEALREVEDCRNQLGFRWVGELCNYIGPHQYRYDSPQFEALVRKVVELKMILHVHTEGDEMKYVIEKFPQATLVFAHFGDDHEYDHIFKRIDLVAQHSNCYLDTSGYGHDRVGVLEYAVKTIGPDRILFGSDFTINDPSTVMARIQNAFLSEEEKKKILSANLEALLKKPGV